ncbi:aminoacyl-tRNA hydrolase [Corynebacterium ciconiae]|uniref:aminoacyl-tRNA hydrolase n=1 Tax=Corynebacterium ciconiae TaxID=227319 RepID=UPI0003799C12|nr:aminoacyl-tRNA hydrolase [Corynebacterium ciconiae]
MHGFDNLTDSLRSFFARLGSKTPIPTTTLPERIDYLILGLGNPGGRYDATRHNVGYMAVDDILATRGDILTPVHGAPLSIAVTDHDGRCIVVARSQTYMNNSGEAIEAIRQHLELDASQVLVIHDELDLPAGAVKIKRGGNENGHNGLKSLSAALGTRDYVRVRIGIGRPPKNESIPIPTWVLSPIDSSPEMEEAIARAAEGAWLAAADSVSAAQNRINRR